MKGTGMRPRLRAVTDESKAEARRQSADREAAMSVRAGTQHGWATMVKLRGTIIEVPVSPMKQAFLLVSCYLPRCSPEIIPASMDTRWRVKQETKIAVCFFLYRQVCLFKQTRLSPVFKI